jgi:hypothetical protein
MSDVVTTLAIRALADDEARLRERVRQLERDLVAYRELACAALTRVHEVSRERDQLREQFWRLRDEYRHLREATLRTANAA